MKDDKGKDQDSPFEQWLSREIDTSALVMYRIALMLVLGTGICLATLWGLDYFVGGIWE